MNFNWDLFSRFAGPVLGVLAGIIINRYWEKRPKLISYLVVTSFFPLSLIGTCEVERLIVFCGSRPPFQQESRRCALLAFFSIG